MPDSSSNRPAAPGDDHVVSVMREIGELMKIEQLLVQCKNNGERYHTLAVLIQREGAHAVNLPPPNDARPGSLPFRTWETDMKRMRQVLVEFRARRPPSMPTPFVRPLRGMQPVAYQIVLPGERYLGTVEADDIDKVLPALLVREDEKAFYMAMLPLEAWHAEILSLLDKYGEWRLDTEVALRLADYTDVNVANAISTAAVPVAGGADEPEEEEFEADSDEEAPFQFMGEKSTPD